ncbi:ABC transporter ATP-binding protein [Christiangramia aquimixticola]|uniref:ABC transporter ATP-binding protein n=1 Tax=Christiangramia aquimixticola TaxID=1697558 RepID=UPI003AA8E2F0
MNKDSANIILETRNLEIGYRKKKSTVCVASEINLNIEPGELTAVIGINGAGKSTLLKTLSGVIQNIKGQVIIKNKNIFTLTPSELSKHIGLVLTEQAVSKNLSVIELVALGRQPYTNWIGTLSRKDLKRISQALDMVNIESLKNKKCHELSDGQFQKVMIARAIAQDTSIIILDEPTTHLDMYHTAYVLKLLKKLSSKTGKAILFATHEINLALQLCDKLVIIKDKKTLFGKPADLIASGNLNDLFPDELIEFDKNSSSFRIKK